MMKPVEVTRGSVTVRIYPTAWHDKSRRKHYPAHIIIYHDATGRRREKRNTLAAAKIRAEEIATSIANGERAIGHLDNATKVRTLDWLARARALGLSPEAIFTRGEAELLRERSRTEIVHKLCPAIVAEFFEKRVMGAKWRRILGLMLERFSTRFPGPLVELLARDVDDWLDGLKLSLRSRRNYRAALQNLLGFAAQRGYVPKDFTLLADITNPEPAAQEINIYTPEEMLRLLTAAESSTAGRKLVPFICITAFAGVRHGEMNEEKARLLDWSDLDFASRGIYIAKGTAKTGNDRAVDMPDNLVAWLEPYRQNTGRICDLANTSNALCRMRIKAGIQGPKRNALRKSFITYKTALTRDIAGVADQAGNSAAIIRKNYKRTDTRMRQAAQRWFAIMPTRADVLSLFPDWGRDAVTKAAPTR